MSSELRVAHCPKCGKVYQINVRNLCTACSAAEDAQLRAIGEPLSRDRKLTNEQLAEASGVPEDLIRGLIRAGKLRLFDYPNLADACDRCHAPIRKGTMCLACVTKIQDEIEHAIEQDRLFKERMQRQTYISRD